MHMLLPDSSCNSDLTPHSQGSDLCEPVMSCVAAIGTVEPVQWNTSLIGTPVIFGGSLLSQLAYYVLTVQLLLIHNF